MSKLLCNEAPSMVEIEKTPTNIPAILIGRQSDKICHIRQQLILDVKLNLV